MPTAVSLTQMVDLALGTPEVGAVNFNILHSLLQSMLQKLNISQVKGEINDSDRDLLQSVQAKQRIGAASTISVDSGREDSEDGFSEKSAPATRRAPYHYLEQKVEKIAQQLEQFNDLPSNAQLIERAQSKGDAEGPLHEMWQYMQLKKRVDANEDGVGKLMSMFDNMLAEMQKLKSSQEELQNKIKSLPDMKDWIEKLKELEKNTNALNEKFSTLPSPEEFSQFVTWPALEAALSGVREDLEKLSAQPERVVIEMSSQTEGVPSRPASSRPLSRLSTTSSGPSSELLDILEKLGNLSESHEALRQRVDELEEQLKNKLDKDALENLNISSDVLEQIAALKEELDALAQARAKVDLIKTNSDSETDSTPDSTPEDRKSVLKLSLSDTQLLHLVNEQEMAKIAIDSMKDKMDAMEDRFKVFREMFTDDSAYQSDISDLKGWLTDIEGKHSKMIEQLSSMDTSIEVPVEPAESVEAPVEAVESEIDTPVEEPQPPYDRRCSVSVYNSELMDLLNDLEATSPPEMEHLSKRLRRLAGTVNEQLNSVRDKVFLIDQDLKRMAKGVEFALFKSKISGRSDLDNEALTRVQQALLQLQAEVEKIHNVTEDMIEDNKERAKQIENLNNYCDTLHENKADKEFVAMEVDVKADKRSLDCKVNHSLFDSTTNEINKLIKDLLDKLSGNEDNWKTTYKQLTEDIEGKLDRMELDPLKEWLESRLKALNKKILTQSKDWNEDDAAGIRKQLIQKFHCISCDRPVDMMPTGTNNPALPSQNGLPPTRSPRPYTTFELDQIRQHAKKGSGGNAINFERALAEKQVARMRKADLKAFLVHFGQDLAAFRQKQETYLNPEISDYYATVRPCGGSHTMTYPHKRTTKLSNLSNLFKEEAEPAAPASTTVIPLYKEEVDVQGQDGHIYKGRVERIQLEAKLPSVSAMNNNAQVPVGGAQGQLFSPAPPNYPQPNQETQTRPMSARMASRHQSDHQLAPDSSRTTPSPVFGEN